MELTVSASGRKIDFPVLWMGNNNSVTTSPWSLKETKFEYKIYRILSNGCPNSFTMSHPLAITTGTLRCYAKKTQRERMFPLSSNLPSYGDKKIEDSPQKHVVNALKWTFYDVECFHLRFVRFLSFELFARRKNWIKFKWQINMTQYDFLLIS